MFFLSSLLLPFEYSRNLNLYRIISFGELAPSILSKKYLAQLYSSARTSKKEIGRKGALQLLSLRSDNLFVSSGSLFSIFSVEYLEDAPFDGAQPGR
jgi:hypothetical protein